ncbi:hypothetical protein [Corynebacterium coyleae]|uniref:hypothetical protein n=1 Tax=Corynebacterium coyleae TaxID=53374 RepID=UPI00254EECF6|nr:hypothetical protein [Corynebacterium coyleae]MDK8242146.1 hypothetical protein [Corynebacterium coyleae]
MASMSNCESIANSLASKLKTSIKTKTAGTDKGMAYCSGTFTNNRSFSILDIDEDKRCNVEVSDNSVTATINVPSSYSNSYIANRAGNAYNGANSNS